MPNDGNLRGHFDVNTQTISIHGTPGIGKSDLLSQVYGSTHALMANALSAIHAHTVLIDGIAHLGHDADTQQGSPCDAFSQAAKSVACGALSSSQQDFHERLTAQLQRDADGIRKTCAYVRDPSAPRVVEYKSGDDLMAVTRGLCLGR